MQFPKVMFSRKHVFVQIIKMYLSQFLVCNGGGVARRDFARSLNRGGGGEEISNLKSGRGSSFNSCTNISNPAASKFVCREEK